MRWRLVAQLAPLGFAIGILSLFGWFPLWFEALEWFLVGAAWVAVLHLRLEERHFLHGLLIAFLGGFGAILVQVLFATTYFHNNPVIAHQYGVDPDHVTARARWAIVAGGLLATTVFALIIGAAAWLARPIPDDA